MGSKSTWTILFGVVIIIKGTSGVNSKVPGPNSAWTINCRVRSIVQVPTRRNTWTILFGVIAIAKGPKNTWTKLFDVMIKHNEATHQNLNYTISGDNRINGSRHAWSIQFGVIGIVEGLY